MELKAELPIRVFPSDPVFTEYRIRFPVFESRIRRCLFYTGQVLIVFQRVRSGSAALVVSMD